MLPQEQLSPDASLQPSLQPPPLLAAAAPNLGFSIHIPSLEKAFSDLPGLDEGPQHGLP